MDLAMRQGYGACALPLCGGGRLLLGRSETDQFLFFFSIFIFFIVFSCVLFVRSSPRGTMSSVLGAERTALRDSICSTKSKINKTHSLTRDTIPE